MKARSRGVTVVLQPDGATRSHTFRIPLWALRVGLGLAAGAAIGAIVVAAFYGPMVRAAARVPGLEREVARLESDNAKVRQLSAALDSVESRYAQVRQMIGADILHDPLTLGAALPVAPPLRAGLAGRGRAARRARGGQKRVRPNRPRVLWRPIRPQAARRSSRRLIRPGLVARSAAIRSRVVSPRSWRIRRRSQA